MLLRAYHLVLRSMPLDLPTVAMVMGSSNTDPLNLETARATARAAMSFLTEAALLAAVRAAGRLPGRLPGRLVRGLWRRERAVEPVLESELPVRSMMLMGRLPLRLSLFMRFGQIFFDLDGVFTWTRTDDGREAVGEPGPG